MTEEVRRTPNNPANSPFTSNAMIVNNNKAKRATGGEPENSRWLFPLTSSLISQPNRLSSSREKSLSELKMEPTGEISTT